MSHTIMNRIDAMRIILDHLPNEPVIANCGATSRELASIHRSAQHLYILDSMGIASSVGLGLALALAESAAKRVVVLEGDGALLMNLTSLASIAYHQPHKLLLVVLDNESYASTGGQATYTQRVNLGDMAEAAGLATLRATDEVELEATLSQLDDIDGPVFLHVKIAAGNAPDIPLLLEDPAVIAHEFAAWVKTLI
ncbi:MAG: thiamine pyrophosphate-dependent enzyme [Chloroflexota bacterium]